MKYITLLFIAVLPITTFASHNDRERAPMGGDAVDSFAIPVLFALDIDQVTPDFGAPRGGGTRTHEGQDFIAPKGTPIVSPTKAIVTSKGTGSSAGKYVYTANPGGESFRYMHLDEIADIDVGDRLSVGDYIGTVGDTGNAPEGVYHLHFETLDEDRTPIDPYPRITDEFTLEDQIEFLDDVFSKRRDDDKYATFLVETFPDVFRQALAEDIDLPRAIDRALEGTDIAESINELESVQKLIESIPSLLPIEIKTGDSGATVALLQIYLIYGSEGPARDQLAAAGPTGYYGSITAAAVEELQDEERISESGVYDTKTHLVFADRTIERLNLGL